jgi:hypothetical protein
MTLSVVVDTDLAGSDEAGASLGERIRDAFDVADALAGHTEELVADLNVATGGLYSFVGGGAGGDAAFQRRFVFCGTGRKPAVAIFFDCVATRLRMGKEFAFELDAVRSALGDTPFAGCNSIGQIARSEGQMSGFHNCTAVVCVFPE